jgi:FkbM family methyltransferase
LPHFRGRFRLIRFFAASFLNRAKDVELSGKFGIIYKIPNAKESIGFELFANGIYEWAYIKLMIQKIPANGTMLDLGANIGSIAIPIAKLRPDVKIIAVEASSRVFSYLIHNVKKNNCANISVENKALATEDHQMVSFYSPTELYGKGSLKPVFTNIAESVETISLDTLVATHHLSRVDFIKLDVEGFEKIVLSGGLKLLSGAIAPGILFEFSGHMEAQIENSQAGDCQRLLQSLGYTLYDVSNPKKAVFMPNVSKEGDKMILAEKS